MKIFNIKKNCSMDERYKTKEDSDVKIKVILVINWHRGRAPVSNSLGRGFDSRSGPIFRQLIRSRNGSLSPLSCPLSLFLFGIALAAVVCT